MPGSADRSVGICLILLLSLFSLPKKMFGQEDGNHGAEVYAKHCASCHDQSAVRIPSRSVLQQRTSGYIFKILNTGIMKTQAATLSSDDRGAIAQWLGRKTAAGIDASKITNACKAGPAVASGAAGPSWTSWGAGLANLRFQPASAAGLSAAQAGRLKLKWAFGVPDVTMMRSQPAVYGGNIFFSAGTMLYSLDASTGCTRWETELPAAIRSGISIGSPGGKAVIFFGDSTAGVHAIDASTGAPLWQIRADPHPAAVITGTPVYSNGKLYVGVSSYEEATALTPGYLCCKFRGSVLALDANSGKTLWHTFTIEGKFTDRINKLGAASIGPSGVAVWSAPTVDLEKNLLYVATGDNYSDPPTALSDAVLALELDTGKIAWSHQFRTGDAWNESCMTTDVKNCPDAGGPDFDFGSSPILLHLKGGHRALILAQKSGKIFAVDPDKRGKLLWTAQVGTGGVLGGIEWGPSSDSVRLYVALSDESFLPGAQPNVDPSKGGGLFALSLATGKQLWATPPSPCDARRPCSPAQTAAITSIPGLVISGSLNGHVRAYSADDGAVLWDYDTVRDFKTINEVSGHGGSISVAGPVVVDGTMYVLSGYDAFGEAPGNVLLAFTVDGQ